MSLALTQELELIAAANKTQVVLLPGWGHDSTIWGEFGNYLDEHFLVHRIDYPGIGGMPGICPPNVDRLIELMLPGLPPKAAFIGWSMGGLVASRYAARFPERVSHLVLLASNPRFIEDVSHSEAMSVSDFESFEARYQADGAAALKYFQTLQLAGDSEARALKRALPEPVIPPNSQSLVNGLEMLKHTDVRNDLAGSDIPLLAMYGERDQLVPVKVAEKLKAIRGDCSTHVFKGHAHMPFRNEPRMAASRITDFILEHSQARVAENPEKNEIARSFSEAAEHYDVAASLQRKLGDELLNLLAEHRWRRALDVGCGTGYICQHLSQSSPEASVIGLDLASGMLLEARRRGSAMADWLCADAEQLPLADESVDLVLSNLAIQWCPDPNRLAREWFRVLQPGGVVAVSTLGPGTLWELRAAWRCVDAKTHVNHFTPLSAIDDAFAQAGFQLTQVKTEEDIRDYQQVSDLARELKTLGAHNVNKGRHSGLVSPCGWRRMVDFYERLRDERGLLPATWHTHILLLKKPLDAINRPGDAQ